MFKVNCFIKESESYMNRRLRLTREQITNNLCKVSDLGTLARVSSWLNIRRVEEYKKRTRGY